MTRKVKKMRNDVYEKAINYFNDHYTEFCNWIENLDSYSGYLDYDDRYYEMDFFDEYMGDRSATDILDSISSKFDTSDYYFVVPAYGGVITSTNEKDYENHLDEDFIDALYKDKEDLERIYEKLPDYITKLFEIEDEDDDFDDDEEDEE